MNLFDVYLFMCYSNSYIFEFINACHAGTNNQKKELFVMTICSSTGKTFPENFTIIPSAKKWVFHAIYCLAFLSLYDEHICSLNRLVITDEEDADYCSFETLILTHEMFRSSTVMPCRFHAIWQPFKRHIYVRAKAISSILLVQIKITSTIKRCNCRS